MSKHSDTTFAESVGGDKHFLVAFTAPWCGHCKNLAPIWEKVANDFVLDSEVLIAKVDAEAANSKAVTAEQVTSYPTIKWFPAGSKGVSYSSRRKEEDFVEWVNENAGTQRLPGGGLSPVAGTVASLDALVAKLLRGDALSEVASQVSEEAEKLKNDAQYKYAEYYVRVFQKLNKSDGYAAKELTRLDGFLTKGGLAPAKRDEVQRKTNVLRRFVEQASEKVEEKVEEIKDEL